MRGPVVRLGAVARRPPFESAILRHLDETAGGVPDAGLERRSSRMLCEFDSIEHVDLRDP